MSPLGRDSVTGDSPLSVRDVFYRKTRGVSGRGMLIQAHEAVQQTSPIRLSGNLSALGWG